MPQQWKTDIMVLQKNKSRTECGNYRGILLVAHAGKILLKIVARRLSEYSERVGVLPEELEWFPTEPFYHRYDVCDSSVTGVFYHRYDVCDSSVTDVGAEEMNFVVVCFIDLTKAYDSIDRTLLWTLLTRFGVSQEKNDLDYSSIPL